MKVLVLTDRFPPYSEGGAEISLAILLSKLVDDGFTFSIITFSEDISDTEISYHQNIPVYRVPYSSSWPVVFWEKRKTLNVRPTIIGKVLHRLFAYSAYFMKAIKNKDFVLKIRKGRLFQRLARRRLLRYFPLIDEDISDVASTKQCIKRIFSEFKPDLVHADNFRSIVLSQGLFEGTPVVNQVRDNRFFCVNKAQPMNIRGIICRSCEFGCVDDAPKEYLDDIKYFMMRDLRFRQKALANANHVIVTSRFLKAQVQEFVARHRVSIVTNPVDDRDDDVKRDRRSTFPPEILIVGMINDNKGQLRVLEWIDALDNALIDYRIVIAGRGDRIESILKRRLKTRDVSDRVFLTGYLSRGELHRTYDRATIVACPNVWPEPFGRVPLEAGLARKAVVAFDAGGISENIIDGVTGVLVPENNNVAFVRTLIDLIKNPVKAKKFGDNAYNFVRENYKVECSANDLIKVWRDAGAPLI